jgi:hypothetical protein
MAEIESEVLNSMTLKATIFSDMVLCTAVVFFFWLVICLIHSLTLKVEAVLSPHAP